MAFLGFLIPPGPNQIPTGVPIVQLMFLYEARARACARLVQEHHQHMQLGPHFTRFQLN